MVGRILGKVLRGGDCGLNTGVRAFCWQRRTFSSTTNARTKDRVPQFTETSSEELNQLLSTFRLKSFLPAHLSAPHKKLIYADKSKQLLQDEPVRVNIGGEQFQLEHVDRTKDVLHNIKHLFQAVGLMSDKKEWKNLPPLLEGIYFSDGTKLKLMHWSKLARKAGLAGCMDQIISSAQRVSKTGLQLNETSLVVEILWWIQRNAWQSRLPPLNHSKARKSLAMAEQVAALLESEAHCGGPIRGSTDPRTRPEVIGILLELACAASTQQPGMDANGKVNMYADRLIANMGPGFDWRDGWEETVQEGYFARDRLLRNASPVLFGLRHASKILGPASANLKQLKKLEKGLAAELDEAYAKFIEEQPDKRSIGRESYEWLVLEKQHISQEKQEEPVAEIEPALESTT